jgi:hypothetical protein
MLVWQYAKLNADAKVICAHEKACFGSCTSLHGRNVEALRYETIK